MYYERTSTAPRKTNVWGKKYLFKTMCHWPQITGWPPYPGYGPWISQGGKSCYHKRQAKGLGRSLRLGKNQQMEQFTHIFWSALKFSFPYPFSSFMYPDWIEIIILSPIYFLDVCLCKFSQSICITLEFVVMDKEIILVNVGHHGEVYYNFLSSIVLISGSW